MAHTFTFHLYPWILKYLQGDGKELLNIFIRKPPNRRVLTAVIK
jgi:hypothetical protein